MCLRDVLKRCICFETLYQSRQVKLILPNKWPLNFCLLKQQKSYSGKNCSVFFSVPLHSSCPPCGDSEIQATLIWWLCIFKTRPPRDRSSRRERFESCTEFYSPKLSSVTCAHIYISQNYHIFPVNCMVLDKCKLLHIQQRKQNKILVSNH